MTDEKGILCVCVCVCVRLSMYVYVCVYFNISAYTHIHTLSSVRACVFCDSGSPALAHVRFNDLDLETISDLPRGLEPTTFDRPGRRSTD